MMKKLNFLAIGLAVLFISCENEIRNEQQNEISPTILERLEEMGFDVTSIPPYRSDDGVVLEGDMVLSLEQFNVDAPDNDLITKQRRIYNLVSCKRARNVTIRSLLPAKSVPHKQLARAVKKLNEISGSFLKLKIVDRKNKKADITVQADKGVLSNFTVGQAELPKSGRPGKTIKLNFDFYKSWDINLNKKGKRIQLSANQWTHNLMHEISHCVGLAHNDDNEYTYKLIPGTPLADKNSIMLGNDLSNLKKGVINFSKNDKKAFRWLYSSKSGNCKGR